MSRHVQKQLNDRKLKNSRIKQKNIFLQSQKQTKEKLINKINKKKEMVLPKVNMFVGLCALSFQAFILYPWHNVISEQVNKLDENIRVLEIMQQQLVKEAEQLQKLNPA